MRVTDKQVMEEALRHVREGQARLAEHSQKAASGVRVDRPSDDPLAYNQAQEDSDRLTRLAGYGQNIDRARARLGATDSNLQSAQGVITRLREVTLYAASATGDPVGAAIEAQGLRDQLAQLMNGSYEGEYLYSGYSGAAPFNPQTGVFSGDNQKRAVEISPLGATQLGVSAQDAFGVQPGQSALTSIDQAIAAMRAGNTAGVRAGLSALDGMQKQVAQAQSLLGTQLNTLNLAEQSNQSHKLQLSAGLSEARDIDPAETYSALAADRYALEATYAVLGNQNRLSLLKYL